MVNFCSGQAIVQWYKSGENFEIDSDDVEWEFLSGGSRGMGQENIYVGTINHEFLGELSWTVSEYPPNVLNHIDYNLNSNTLIKDFEFNFVDQGQEFDFEYEFQGQELEVEDLTKWFFDNYEDPANSLPYNTKEGGYQWIAGGPFDAREVLHDNFPSANDDIIERAVNIIEQHGTVDWTPSTKNLEISGFFDPLEDELPFIKLGVAKTSSDSAGPEVVDHLNVEKEAKDIARYISLRSLDTPMSIALFGDWGAGKSFLMNKIRVAVEEISIQSSALHKDGKACSYCNGVVPIEFNAWHYIESNLWASLTTHIFSELNKWPGNSDSKRNQIDSLFRQLDTAKEERERAEQKIEKAKEVTRDYEKELVSARDRLKEEVEKSQINSVSTIWTAVRKTISGSPELKEDLEEIKKKLGIDGFSSSLEDFDKLLHDAKSLRRRGHMMLSVMLSKRAVYVIACISLLLIPSIAAYLANKLELGAGVGAIAGVFATVSGVVGYGMNHAHKALMLVNRFGKQVEGAIAEETRKYHEKVVEAEAQVEAARGQVSLAEVRLQEAQIKVDDLVLDLEETTPQARLNAFIRDQAANAEYTEHLGIVSSIRRDFETLSKLMSPSDEEHSNAARVEEKLDRILPKNKTFERIVLYVDDLDRCPPARVVEVLQAIHLLLAFPLFVVLVAVDARWVARALKEHYPTLLIDNEVNRGEASSQTKDGFTGKSKIDNAASSHDYLEKIFQVPFWVKPVDEDSSREFVNGLLALDPNIGRDLKTDHKDTEMAVVDSTSIEVKTKSNSSTDTRSPRETKVSGAYIGEEFDPNPVAAEITSYERDYIAAMAPYVGYSPRRLKRFVNLYRLIKAGLVGEEARFFVGDLGQSIQFKAVLTNLSIVIGAPISASECFRLFDRTYRKRTGPYGENFDELVEAIKHHGKLDNVEIQRVLGALKTYSSSTGIDSDSQLNSLRSWAQHVSRFSFTSRPK